MERLADLLAERGCRSLAGVGGQLGRLACEPRDLVALRGRGTLERPAVTAREQLLLRRSQLLARGKQPLDALGAPPRQLVQRPGRDGRLAQRLDRVGLLTLARFAKRLRALVARTRELTGRQGVEIVGHAHILTLALPSGG